MTTVIPDSAQNHKVIRSTDDLIQYFHRGDKRESQFLIGLEHEKIGFARSQDGMYHPLPYEAAKGQPQIMELFNKLTQLGWRPLLEDGKIIALSNEHGSITLEPGGQFEFSGAPKQDAQTAVQELDDHLRELLPLAESMGIVFIGCGFRPFGTLTDVPKVPKDRYRVMREYLPQHGTFGLEMMHQTATAQVNLDYSSEADALEKMRVALSASPLVTALFAASPLKEGKPSGYQSYRALCWLDTDNARCGLLPFVYQSDALFANYTNWALDIPMFFVYRHHHYQSVPNLTFRRFMKEGYQGEAATFQDWEVHLSTLFPDARLRQYIEVRSADSGPLPLVRALGCFWRGLLYSNTARNAAWSLIKDWSFEELNSLRSLVPKFGMRTKMGKTTIAGQCQELVEIAGRGLLDLKAHQEFKLLEPLREIAKTQRSTADQILELFDQTNGDPSRMIHKLRYQ